MCIRDSNRSSGNANPIWVIGSGGVNIAAILNIIIIIYFLLFLKYSASTKPTYASNVNKTGN